MTHLESGLHDRTIGSILVLTAVLTVFTMGHHPSGHDGALGPLVHGVMLLLLSSMFFCLCYYSLRRDLRRPLVLSAQVAYLLNYIAHVIAATINGFIVPAVAEQQPDISHSFFIVAWESNQAFATLGTVATAFAFSFWGLDLFRRETGYAKILGVAGITAGVLPVVFLTIDSTMDVRMAMIMYSLHAGFLALLGAWMIRKGK